MYLFVLFEFVFAHAHIHQSGAFYYLPAPLSFAKRIIHGTTLINWNQDWITTSNGACTRLFFPTLQHRLLARFYNPDFFSTQFISGHGKFGSYLDRLNIRSSSSCHCDSPSPQTPSHLLFDCPDTRPLQGPIRLHYLNTGRSFDESLPSCFHSPQSPRLFNSLFRQTHSLLSTWDTSATA